MKKIFFTFVGFLAAALVCELSVLALTKALGWDNFVSGRPFLAAVHVHLLVLGALFFLIQLLLEKNFSLTQNKLYKVFHIVFLVGISLTVALMYYKGVCQLLDASVIRGITEAGAAIGHTLLVAGLALFAVCLYGQLFPKKKDEK